MIENRLLDQFNSVIASQWSSINIMEEYEPLTIKELFELAYHTNNKLGMRSIFVKLSQNENKGGSKAIFYSNTKKFTSLEALDDKLSITKYFNVGEKGDKLSSEIHPTLKLRKEKFATKDNDIKEQILKSILVERKLDECANLVMIKDISRKVYFAIGDARESAAIVPMFMEAEGANLVQLALNRWMTFTQNLEHEKSFPESYVPGLLKNLTQIKKWLLNLINIALDK